MANDPLDDRLLSLRTMRLAGPRLGTDDPRPLWQLWAGAPQFGRMNAIDRTGRAKGTGVTADHVHSLRVLLADRPAESESWWRPRLLDLHVAFGAASSTADHNYSWTRDALEIALDPGGAPIGADRGGMLQALPEPSDAPADARAHFAHVVGEPLAGEAIWPPDDWEADRIATPVIRVTAGRIGVRATLRTSAGRQTRCTWLEGLGLIAEPEKPGGERGGQLWLTPDGIEFDAELPFPGRHPRLHGRVLLTSDTPNGTPVFTLTLLRPVAGQERDWIDAWRAITPAGFEEEALAGLSFKADHGVVPGFRWQVKNDRKGVELGTAIDVPGAALSIALTSPPVRKVVDGAARLLLPWVTVRQDKSGIVFSARAGTITKAPALTVQSGAKGPLKVTTDQPVALDIDDHGLARDLRAAYGLPTPPPLTREPGGQDDPDIDRPLLPAFVPLPNGWLQVHVPNLAPIDVSLDANLAAAPAKARSSVLDGFFRLRRPGAGSAVISGYCRNDPAPATPFEITVERAAGVAVDVRVSPGTPATLTEAEVALHGATVVARGLLVASSARPDAFEALPRLGAGPGLIIPVTMRGTLGDDAALSSVVGVDLLALEVSCPARDGDVELAKAVMALTFDPTRQRWTEIYERASARARLDAARHVVLGTAIDASGGVPLPAVVWRRHPVTPLAATMPMTRAARAAVQPLESRDLVPFTIAPVLAGSASRPARVRCAVVTRAAGKPLPELTGPALTRIAGWPWNDGQAKPPEEGGRPERGVFFAAVGVPGVEWRPTAATGPGTDFEGALRYDLPTLDEAFATAETPPAAGEDASPTPAGTPAETPLETVPTALDWPALGRFWNEQERKLQNARVVDSYVTPFRTGAFNDPVKNLIRGAAWNVTVTAAHAPADRSVPYGSVTLRDSDGKGEPARGNQALLGHARRYEVAGGVLTPSAKGAVEVLGFAPSTYVDRGVHLDNRRTGAAKPAVGGAFMVRDVRVGGEARRLVSLIAPIETAINGAPLGFWFKDVLVRDTDAILPDQKWIAFNVWDDAETLAASGLEWRLVPLDPRTAERAFEEGRDTIPFFGFRLEPLRLKSLSLANAGADMSLASAEILCRLSLGPAEVTPDPAANLVVLMLRRVAGGTVQATIAQEEPATALRFVLDCRDDAPVRERGAVNRERRAVATMTLAAEADHFRPWVKALTLDIAGSAVEMVGVEDASAAVTMPTDLLGPLAIEVTRTPPEPEPGCALLAISKLRIEVGERGPRIEALHGTFRLVTAKASAAAPVLSIENARIGGKVAAEPVVKVMSATVKALTVLIVEGEGAITISVDDGRLAFEEAAFTVAFALAARVTPSAPGTLSLVVGHAEGEIVQTDAKEAKVLPGVTLAQARARIVATARAGSPKPWRGEITVSGLVAAENAIAWPSLGWDDEDAHIPIPVDVRKGEVNDGRVRVRKGTGGGASHWVTWLFSGHRVPVGTAAAIAADDADAVWQTPVMARHRLARTQGGKETSLTWTGIETVAIGRPQAIVPPLAIPSGFASDATTFAPRYKQMLKGGEFNGPAAGMRRPGRGAIATVLQGALGAAFRSAFHARECTETLLIAGGFLGLVETAGATPLLKLPVLAGLAESDRIGQTALHTTESLELAWLDGPAARLVAVTRPTGPRPASAALDAITTALVAGSRPLPQGSDGEAGDPVGAILVEQSFPAEEFPGAVTDRTPIPPAGALGAAPFFLAAAVTVERVMRSVAADAAQVRTAAVSLVAGYLPRGERRHPLAATLRLLDAEPVLPAEAPRSIIAVVGGNVAIEPWTGPDPDEDAQPGQPSFAAIVAGFAIGRDTMPVAALVVTPMPSDAPATRLTPLILRSDTLDALGEQARGEARFPDLGRGPLALPGMGTSSWMHPPLEGPAGAIRDHDEARSGARSGIAGLARRVALPQQAGEAQPLSGATPPQLVWMAQSRVPVYLPLMTKGLAGPPIGWLTPAAPRARLPAGADLLDALRPPTPKTRNADGGGASAGHEVQPFLPDAIDAAEIGERAGIVTVRRTRFLSALGGNVTAFDAEHSQFGRPAQAGSSFARTLRTPRPGPLPENTGDAARDRRIQASPLKPGTPIGAFLGSADTVGGQHGTFGQWAVTVVASPETRSIVSDRWDGTVRLICRVEIQPDKMPDASPETVLAALLLAPDDTREASDTRSRALLKIGDKVVPLRWLVWIGKSGWSSRPAEEEPSDKSPVLQTAQVEVVLDPFASNVAGAEPAATPGLPRAEIGAALSTPGPLPPVELQWTVHPSASRGTAGVPAGKSLRLARTDETPLSLGEDRAPLTLRLPLYPVTAERGALPLTPATILFNDPAYDRDLASLPVADILPIPEAGVIDPAPGRGRLRLALHADRGQVNRRGTVTLMLDLRYERPLDEGAQAIADANSASAGGDLMQDSEKGRQRRGQLRFRLVPRSGTSRPLRLGKAEAAGITPAAICELALAALTEMDGAPARLTAGDMLVLEAGFPNADDAAKAFHVWDTATGAAKQLKVNGAELARTVVTIRLVLTDEPVIPPPSALFAGLLRSRTGPGTGPGSWAIATVLHAQSPLPFRVDLVAPARDFRHGLMRRSATFVWTLVRPHAEYGGEALAVIKQDRNGQTWLPEREDDFARPEEFSI